MEVNSLFNHENQVDEPTFISIWEFAKASGVISYANENNEMVCFVNENPFATFDGEILSIRAVLSEEVKNLARKILEAEGFLRPVREEIQYYPISKKIEGSSYICNYFIVNEEHEVVVALKNMNLDKSVSAIAKRKDLFNYEIEIQINENPFSAYKIKKIGNTAVKSALVCLCVSWIGMVDSVASEPVDGLDYTTEREQQIIKYKKIIDKHIQADQMENKFNQRVELYQSHEDFEKDKLNKMKKSANSAFKEILNVDYKFEEKLRNKLNQLEDEWFGSKENRTEYVSKIKNVEDSGSQEEAVLKLKNRIRLLQGRAQFEAEYRDLVKMKVEANAFASDKIKANIQTKKVQFKELGIEVYGQVRYMSKDNTVVSEIRSGFGNNLDISISNRNTQEKDKPASEQVIEMRYQIDF